MRCTAITSLVLLLPWLSACAEKSESTPRAVTQISHRLVDSPAGPGSAQVRAILGADQRTYLTWIESSRSEASLLFSVRKGGEWTSPKTIAKGANWFVNWADFPSFAALADGTLAASWLQRMGKDTYAYGVRISCSTDGGDHWSEPFWLHADRTPTEHGFVSLVAYGEKKFLATWLDGNGLKARGNMELRSVTFDAKGEIGEEAVVDDRVCECCATSVTSIGSETLVVYRNRSAEEVRDIFVGRRTEDGWLKPKLCHDDGWLSPG